MRGPSRKISSRTELEEVLLIKSEDPARTLRKIAELRAIGEYQLVPRIPEKIHDIYFDTVDRSLGSRGINFRIRNLGGSDWITLKQTPRRTPWGGRARKETEIPWSYEGLLKVLEELRRRGVKLGHESEDNSFADPVMVMRTLGLNVLQDRQTAREVRDITGPGSDSGVLAELVIDSVTYDFDGQHISLYELEIEAKSTKGKKLLGSIRGKLLTLFGSELQEWRHGKLVTGRAIEKLLRDGKLQTLLDNGLLSPKAYGLLERAIG